MEDFRIRSGWQTTATCCALAVVLSTGAGVHPWLQYSRERAAKELKSRALEITYHESDVTPLNEARVYAERALRLTPDDIDALIVLGTCEARTGQTHDALEHTGRAIALAGRVRNRQVKHDLICRAYLAQCDVFIYQEERLRSHLRAGSAFVGIGVTYEPVREDQHGRKWHLRIISTLRGCPAEHAGLKAEDRIVGIDGQSVSSMWEEEAVRALRGPRGSEVRLKVVRKPKGTPEVLEVTVVRDVIHEQQREGAESVVPAPDERVDADDALAALVRAASLVGPDPSARTQAAATARRLASVAVTDAVKRQAVQIASELLAFVRDHHPHHIAGLLERAAVAMDTRDYGHSAALYDQALDVIGSHETDLARARSPYAKEFQAAKLKTQRLRCQIGIAIVSARLGDWSRTRAAYLTAAELNPAIGSVWAGLGNAYRMETKEEGPDFDMARRYLRRALWCDPDNVDALVATGHVFLDMYRRGYSSRATSVSNSAGLADESLLSSAQSFFSRALQCDPSNVDAMLGRGYAALEQYRATASTRGFLRFIDVGAARLARYSFDCASGCSPGGENDPGLTLARALAYHAVADAGIGDDKDIAEAFDTAALLYKRVLAHHPRETDALLGLGALRLSQKDYVSAEGLLRRAWKAGGGGEGHWLLATLRTLQGNPSGAREEYKLALVELKRMCEEKPDSRARELLARVYFRLGMYEEHAREMKRTAEGFRELGDGTNEGE